MSWPDETLADGAPFHTDGGEGSPASQPVAPDPSSWPADVSGTQPAEPEEVPFHQHPRWIERQNELNALKEQVEAYRPLDEWRAEIEQYREAGFTPAELREIRERAALAQQQLPVAPTPDPETEFRAWAEEQLAPHGVNLYDLDAPALVTLQIAYQGQQVQQQLAAQREEIQQAQAVQQARTELLAVQEQFPLFKAAPSFQQALIALWERGQGSMQQYAEQINREYQAQLQQAQATYLQDKQSDARVPVTNGGSAPSPVASGGNFHDLPDNEKDAELLSNLHALTMTP